MSQTGTNLAQMVAVAMRAAAGLSPVEVVPGPLAPLRMAAGIADKKLAYYASPVPDKESWFQTEEGYRIYKNVPICRTGFQTYYGRELKKLPGYKAEWNVADEDIVTVYRPLDEVTHAATLASGEGKSVLDEHPPDPQVLVDALDELDGRTMGHGQNVRVGHVMDDGETCLLADLHVKNPNLNIKIEGGTREISMGYRSVLDKDQDGRYVFTQIRLNHYAVVPRGRAGRAIGIGDSDK